MEMLTEPNEATHRDDVDITEVDICIHCGTNRLLCITWRDISGIGYLECVGCGIRTQENENRETLLRLWNRREKNNLKFLEELTQLTRKYNRILIPTYQGLELIEVKEKEKNFFYQQSMNGCIHWQEGYNANNQDGS